MKLSKAIERQEEIIKTGTLGYTPTAYKAMLLGIEALKAVQFVRRNYPDILSAPLPGETPEEEGEHDKR